ncbi:MAG: helix-turn-helix transcriptional regulator [Paludibacteraceae bacterium]|nr:helix-turn-helix transcriptional regulator [Paludibacteraceae bacterium]
MVERFKKILEKEGLQPRELAAKLGVQPSAISHILNGRNNPGVAILQNVMTVFPNINPEWLLLGKEPMYKNEKALQRDLFGQQYDEKPKIEFSEPQKSQNQPAFIVQEPQPQTIIKEVVHQLPPKEILRIVVYYSDNTFQEFKSN